MRLHPDDIRALAVAVADELVRREQPAPAPAPTKRGGISQLHRDTVDTLERAGLFTKQMFRWVPRIMGLEWPDVPRWIPDLWTIELLDKRLVVVEVIVTSELWGTAKRERIRTWNRVLLEEGWKLQLWTCRPTGQGQLNWCSTDPEYFEPDDLQQDRFIAALRDDDAQEFML